MRMAATAISKYWNIVGPCRYYLGEKDWVPLTVMRKVVEDLSFPVELVPCPVIRMEDGLCASSRNAKLTPEARVAAPALYAALQSAIEAIESGERRLDVLKTSLRERIAKVAPVDYAEIVDARTLRPVDPLEGDLRIVVSANFGGIHLTDNAGVTV